MSDQKNIVTEDIRTDASASKDLPFPDGVIEDDGFITVVATGWTRPMQDQDDQASPSMS